MAVTYQRTKLPTGQPPDEKLFNLLDDRVKDAFDQVNQQVAAAMAKALSALGSAGAIVPVGAIIAFTSHLAGTPALPVNFHLCDGTVIADARSPMRGQTLPNLNTAGTDPLFLGGYTASAAGLVAPQVPTHAHATTGAAGGITATAAVASHTHTEQALSLNAGGSTSLATRTTGSGVETPIGADVTGATAPALSGITAGPDRNTDSTNNGWPHHQKVMWAMRIF